MRISAAGMYDALIKPVKAALLAKIIPIWRPRGPEGAAFKLDDPVPETDGPVPIDLALLSEIMGDDDEAALYQMLALFVDLFPEELAPLDAAIANESPKATRDAAHAAKSSALYAAASTLSAILADIERVAPSRDWAGLTEKVAAARSEFERVVIFVNTTGVGGD